jgi:putative chitinase
MPRAKDTDIAMYLPFFQQYLPQYEVNTPIRLRHFFAQIAVESGSLARVVENLNYSAPRLLAVWPRRFTVAKAWSYAGKPEKIANYVYANRLGNGSEASGDGWKYRGRSLKQVTGLENYRKCSRDLFGDDRLVTNPELLEMPEYSVLAALWFWKSRNLNAVADRRTVRDVTLIVNGGTNGLSDRELFFNRSKTVFA